MINHTLFSYLLVSSIAQLNKILQKRSFSYLFKFKCALITLLSFVFRSTTSSPQITKSNLGSSLAQLLCADNNSGQRSNRLAPVKCNDHGGGLVDPSEALGQVLTKDHSKYFLSLCFNIHSNIVSI